MPFTSYQSIGAVLVEYQIIGLEENFIEERPIAIRESFQEDLDFTLRAFNFKRGESSACEMIIFPILKEVYRHYWQKLTLWSHEFISYDQKLAGVPDYIVAQKSPLGKQVFDRPFLATVEAKKDNFSLGWGQCLAQMVAMQKLNDSSENKPIWGIVSNGTGWEFGKLIENNFTQEIRAYTFSDLEKLMGALNYVFYQCELAVS